VDKEIKARQAAEKAKQKIEKVYKIQATKIVEETATKTLQDNQLLKLEQDIAKLKDDLDNEVKQKSVFELVRL
jgi:hypothetical protein